MFSKAEEERVVLSQLKEELETHNIDQAKMIVKSRFGLASNRINYLWQKYNKDTKFNEVLFYLESENYRIRTYQGSESDIPQLLLAVSPSMLDCHRRYGDVITFDVTYNILRRRAVDNHQWGLGIISGFGSNLEPVVFGYCLIAR